MTRRGLFLDLDGTLADSLPAMCQAYEALLGHYGRRGTAAEFESLNGPPAAVIVERLADAHGIAASTDEILAVYRGFLGRAHRAAQPAAGAREVLERARERGWVTAVVTSATQKDTRAWLVRTKLAELVAVVVGGDDVTRGKPDPEPYRAALRQTDCDAAISLAVEDSMPGAQAALGALLPTFLLGAGDDSAIARTVLYRGRVSGLHELLGRL